MATNNVNQHMYQLTESDLKKKNDKRVRELCKVNFWRGRAELQQMVYVQIHL